ncbi:MAG: hypothetical protein LBQ54_06900 [Planctomycetaceae bacterium]|jgi:alpha-mannosidase|nr:hypothetical protein [Planctomycetaceae bacterium]
MIVLIPCHSLEDFPIDRSPEDANELLSAWSALYHPALIEKNGKLPGWDRASSPSMETERQLVIIPPCCEWLVSGEWRYSRSDATVILSQESDREVLVELALKKLHLQKHGFEDWFVQAFHAFGTVHLLSGLLTRQRHYMNMTDETLLREHLLQAITEYRAGESETAKEKIRQAFEQLQQGREYFYPAQAFFLDLTLTAPGTLSRKLQHALENEPHVNLVLSWECLQKMKAEHPRTWDALKHAVQENRVDLVTDDPGEVPMPLLPVMELMEHFFRSRRQYEEMLGVKPDFYLRSQYGMIPDLPAFLSRTGYKGMLLFSTGGWKINMEGQSRVDWQAPDGRKLDTLVRYPVDADSEDHYLRLPRTLGRILEGDYAPTVTFAHYPGFTKRWLGDLKRMSDYSPVLGRFLTLSDYFATTRYSGKTESLPVSLFQSNHLVRSIEEEQPDPVTSWKTRHIQAEERFLSLGLATLNAAVIGNHPEKTAKIFAHAGSIPMMTEEFARLIAGREKREKTEEGYLLVNPQSFPQKRLLDVSDLSVLPDKSETVLLAKQTGSKKEVLVTVPGMGYTWVGSGTAAVAEEETPPTRRFGFFRPPSSSEPPLAEQTEEGFFLRNEFFELKVDSASGAVVSLFFHNKRRNHFSQQLALRFDEKEREKDHRSTQDPNFGYSLMAADKIGILRNGPLTASLRITGRLMHTDGSPVAVFEETLTVSRGKNRVDFEATLEPSLLPSRSPWVSYYASRSAWGNRLPEPRLGIVTGTCPASSSYLEAPYFADFRDANESVTILGGLPFHRRIGENRLDTLLIVQGETCRSFRWSAAFDTEYPMTEALEMLSPQEMLVSRCGRPKNPSAWLFALEAKNVILKHWEPIFPPAEPEPPKFDYSVREWGYGYDPFPEQEKEKASPEYVPLAERFKNASQPVIGMRLYFLETEGRCVTAPFRSFRPVKKACTVNFLGEEEKVMECDGEKLLIPIGEHEFLPLDLYWQLP